MALANLIFPKENKLATVELDIVVSEGVTTSSTITENPVEQGADVTDHIITNAMSFTMTGMVSDTPVKFLGGLLSRQSLLSAERPTVKAWEELLSLQASKTPFTLVQNLKSYDNVFIESLATTQDKDTSKLLNFTATMKEIIFVGTQEFTGSNFDNQDTSDSMVKTKDEGHKS